GACGRSLHGPASVHPVLAEESAKAQRIRHTPSDASFAVDPLEEADQHQTEVHARHERRTAQLLVIELAAAALAEVIEAGLVQHLVQPLIERLTPELRAIRCHT